jgi:hypothetical protein
MVASADYSYIKGILILEDVFRPNKYPFWGLCHGYMSYVLSATLWINYFYIKYVRHNYIYRDMPALTTAERSRAYRARKRAERGAEYLQDEARKRAERRARNRPVNVEVKQPPEPEQDPEPEPEPAPRVIHAGCPPETIQAQHEIDPSASIKTLTKYNKQLGTLYRKMNPSLAWDCDYTFLQETKKVMAFIDENYVNQSSKLTMYKNILGVVSRLPGYLRYWMIYGKKHKAEKATLQTTVDENKLNPREEKNYIPWDDIMKIGFTDDKKNNIVYGLYTLLPPRRLEYGTLTLTDEKKPDKSKNWLTINKRGVSYIYLNKYKTADTYGQYKISLYQNKGLKRIINEYVKEQEFKAGDTLFSATEQEPGNFGRLIKRVFTVGNRSPGVNLLRHSYISYMNSKTLSVAQKKELAKQMGHSVSVQGEYVRL